MPLFEKSLTLPRPPEEVFDFFIQPSLMIATSPPEMSLQLAEGPERLSLGARVKVRGRRWGFAYHVMTEVTAFEPGRLLVQNQIEGTFRRWEMTQRFEAEGGGTVVRTRVEFDPPGGLLGLAVNEAAVRRELEMISAYRAERLRERFG